MPRRNPYVCVFWPTYLSSFFLVCFFVDLPAFLALVRLVLVFPAAPALTGRAMASAFAPALASGPRPHGRGHGCVFARHADLHVAGALQDRRGTAHRRLGEALERRPLVHDGVRDPQLVGVERGVLALRLLLRIGDRRAEHLVNLLRGQLLREAQDGVRLRHPAAADLVDDEPHLARRLADGPLNRPGLHHSALGAWAASASAASRSAAEPFALWPRNNRVAANSPSLWPTMFSVMYTGMNLFPLCTAKVCPTKSGVIVLRRDQVLKTFFSFFSFRAWIFTRSDGSTYGPFLTLRPIYCVAFPRLRPRTMSLVDGFFLCRVFFPSTLPQGEVGGRPPDVFPSPPPSGWSTGFMATPRTRGWRPSQRLLPALPTDKSSCSAFDTSPIVARHSPRTMRISVERSRRVTWFPSFATTCTPVPAERHS